MVGRAPDKVGCLQRKEGDKYVDVETSFASMWENAHGFANVRVKVHSSQLEPDEEGMIVFDVNLRPIWAK